MSRTHSVRGECDGAAQVIIGITMTAGKMGAGEAENFVHLGSWSSLEQQVPGDPQIDNAPVGLGKALTIRHRCIMSHKASPWENAGCESWMKTLKYEEVYRQEYRKLGEVRACLERFIDKVYNQKRLHSALSYRSPVEFEQSLEPSSREGISV